MNYSSALNNPIFKTIQLASDELNYPTYVVGGWVRDLLLNRKQEKTDIDFVCIGSGIKLAEKVSSLLGNKVTFKVFKNFGTAMIHYNGEDYEFVIEKNISLVDKYIPTGALQSLLENVVKHNKSDGKNVIKTAILINEGWLIITNSKATLASKNESFGTGLENLKARYQLLSDEKIQVHNMDKKFEVSIPIIELSS